MIFHRLVQISSPLRRNLQHRCIRVWLFLVPAALIHLSLIPSIFTHSTHGLHEEMSYDLEYWCHIWCHICYRVSIYDIISFDISNNVKTKQISNMTSFIILCVIPDMDIFITHNITLVLWYLSLFKSEYSCYKWLKL